MYRLLIADDENIIRRGLSERMPWSEIGCEVAGTAKDGFEAIEFIKNSPPDIVITDIKMPRQSGIDVARYVYENFPGIKVIILTGFAEFEYAREAIAYGVAEYALKPVSKDGLTASVKRLILKIDEEKGRNGLSKNAMSPYVGKLYDIEKQLNDRDYEAGRQSVSTLFNALNELVHEKKRFSPLVEKTLNYIDGNYNSNLSLETIAAQIPANPSHLSRTFKKETGEAVVEHINRKRIEKAKELLTFTDKMAYEIAEEVGFNDSTYFSLVFKKITGVSPKDFKNSPYNRLK
ncbi:MAG: response regulator [Oscillospiraceae bacterium]|jgi:two-component system response regulator YesN|nr:response regulator [Oscillospiraceae bacterium]